MPYLEFVWRDETIDHLEQHGVSQSDFEEVVCNPVNRDVSRSSGLPVAFGYTMDGRYVMAVYLHVDDLTILPVTAYVVPELNGDTWQIAPRNVLRARSLPVRRLRCSKIVVALRKNCRTFSIATGAHETHGKSRHCLGNSGVRYMAARCPSRRSPAAPASAQIH